MSANVIAGAADEVGPQRAQVTLGIALTLVVEQEVVHRFLDTDGMIGAAGRRLER